MNPLRRLHSRLTNLPRSKWNKAFRISLGVAIPLNIANMIVVFW
jgi:hypothetical protein